MFKQSRRKSLKLKEKVTFKFEFRASNVPKGWDKLQVSLVPVLIGKVTAKTGKAPAKDGSCQWSEPLFESIHISQDSNGEKNGKEFHKLIVSSGSSRFGILGETTINLMDHLQIVEPVSLALPLQNCKFGSILHVKIWQAAIPKFPGRSFEDQKQVQFNKNAKVLEHDVDQQSEHDSMSLDNDNAFPLSTTSSHSFDSADIPITPAISESYPYGMDAMGDEEFLSLSSSPASTSGRHESGSSIHDNKETLSSGISSHEVFRKQDISSELYHLNTSDRDTSQISEENTFESEYQDEPGSLSRGADVYSNKRRLSNSRRKNHVQRTGSSFEADQGGSRDGLIEMETLKQELLSERKRRAEIENALSLSISECDSLKEEIVRMKSLERTATLKAEQQSQFNNGRHKLEELEDELIYLKGVNSDLSLQLQKTQESNSELLLEIEDLDKLLREKEAEKENNESKESIDNRTQELLQIVENLQKDLKVTEQDKQRLNEENLALVSKIKQLNEELTRKDDISAQLEGAKQHSERLTQENLGLLSKLSNINEELIRKDDVIAQVESDKQYKLKESEEQMFASVEKYEALLQVLEKMKEEKLNVDREMSDILEDKKLEAMARSQLQSSNAIIQQQLHQEQMKVAELLMQIQTNDAKNSQSCQELLIFQAQINCMEQTIVELKANKGVIEAELRDSQEQSCTMKARVGELELQIVDQEKELRSFKLANSSLETEIQSLNGRLRSQEEIMLQLKSGVDEKATLIEQVKELKLKILFLEGELRHEIETSTSMEEKMKEKDMQEKELKMKLLFLEDELQRTMDALTSAEKKLREPDGPKPSSYITRSFTKANSRLGPKSSIQFTGETTDLCDLRDKVKILEEEVKKRAAEVEVSKHQLREQHKQLSLRIEHLELANEELMKERSNSKLDQVLLELNDLQSRNGALLQQEHEYLAMLASKENELEILKKEKLELESALTKISAKGGESILKRISVLENELSEVVEANNMYKLQLQSAFAKHHIVNAAALENAESVEQVIKDLAGLKKKNAMLEDELFELRERYFNMSLQFAEVEADREQLVMTIRTLRGNKKLLPFRSVNF